MLNPSSSKISCNSCNLCNASIHVIYHLVPQYLYDVGSNSHLSRTWHFLTCLDYLIWCLYSQGSVQFSRVRLFVTPWTAACQSSLSITNSPSLPKLMSTELVMPSNHLILCHPTFNLSQHQGLFHWVSSSHQGSQSIEFQLPHQSFQWTLKTDLL